MGKAEKEAAKTASLTKEDKFDAFGNKIRRRRWRRRSPSLSSRSSRSAWPRCERRARRCGPTRRSRRRATHSRACKCGAGRILGTQRALCFSDCCVAQYAHGVSLWTLLPKGRKRELGGRDAGSYPVRARTVDC